ncbi:MAG: prepilin-type N-terminal cleavage/methylation domain-containing protein, partial [Cyanobium sp.]
GQRRSIRQAGFSLVELLVSLLLAGVVSGALLQALLLDSQASQRLGRHLRERQQGQRALELLRQELQQAEWVRRGDQGVLPPGPACSLTGRKVVLQLGTASGLITYAEGPAPDPIWRGRVLLRCGPAYGLDGALAAGPTQHRVLLDALAAKGFTTQSGPKPGLLEISLRRDLAPGQQLEQRLLAAFAIK